MIIRYNREVQVITHHIGDLVIIYQKNINKLQFKWRGSFQIRGYDDTHERSFTLLQFNGRKIKHTYYGDHLKQFVPRSGYLAETSDTSLLSFQTVRHKRIRSSTAFGGRF